MTGSWKISDKIHGTEEENKNKRREKVECIK